MKLKTETKSEYIRRQNKRCLSFVFVFVLLSFGVFAQNQSMQFNQSSLSDALLLVSQTYKVDLAFDQQGLDKVNVSGSFSFHSVEELLTKLLAGSGYTFEKRYGNFLIIPIQPTSAKAAALPYTHLIGTVSDRETGEKLPYASIYFPDDKTFLSTTENGSFNFRKPASQRIHVILTYIGYRSIDSVLVINDTIRHCSFRMTRRPQVLNTVDVKKSKLKMIDSNNEAGHVTVNPVGFTNLPNFGENDVFRTIQLLPGIAYSEGSSKLNIRGSSDDQNLVLFDGFTLYNTDHFFGTFSSINPNVVKDIQVFKGGFDSRYGERLSGIIDIAGKSGNKNNAVYYGGINLVSGNLTAEVPVSKKLTLLAAGRRSYSDIYSTFLMDKLFKQQEGQAQLNGDPNKTVIQPSYFFYDLNTKLTYTPNDNEKLSISFLSGKDFLKSDNQGDLFRINTNTKDENQWGNDGLSLSWMKQWNGELFTSLQIGNSGYYNKYTNNTQVRPHKTGNQQNADTLVVFETFEHNQLRDRSLNLRNNWTASQKTSADFGLQLKNNWYSYYKNAENDQFYNNSENASWLYAMFGQVNNQSIRNLNIKFGGRFDYYNHTNKIYVEPRLSGSYRLSDAFSLKMATGRYYQFLSKVSSSQGYGYNRDFWVISDGKEHPVLSSTHFILGSIYHSGNFSADIEGYYKTIDGIQTYLFIAQYQKNAAPGKFPERINSISLPNMFVSGTGVAYGLDVLLKYERNQYSGWISYSLSKAEQQFSKINNNREIPAPYDQRHDLKWANMVTLNRWNLSGLFVISSGQPYISSYSMDENFNTTRVYGHLPTYSRLDLSANYNLMIGRAKFKIGLSLINVFDTQNYNDIYTREFNFDSTSFTETTYVKSLGFTPNFFLNFQF